MQMQALAHRGRKQLNINISFDFVNLGAATGWPLQTGVLRSHCSFACLG